VIVAPDAYVSADLHSGTIYNVFEVDWHTNGKFGVTVFIATPVAPFIQEPAAMST
jgi:hypothetical protein